MARSQTIVTLDCAQVTQDEVNWASFETVDFQLEVIPQEGGEETVAVFDTKGERTITLSEMEYLLEKMRNHN